MGRPSRAGGQGGAGEDAPGPQRRRAGSVRQRQHAHLVCSRRAVAAPQLLRLSLLASAERAGGVAVAQCAQVVRVPAQKVDCQGGPGVLGRARAGRVSASGSAGRGPCGLQAGTPRPAPASSTRSGTRGPPEGSSRGAAVCESRLDWKTTGSACRRSTAERASSTDAFRRAASSPSARMLLRGMVGGMRPGRGGAGRDESMQQRRHWRRAAGAASERACPRAGCRRGLRCSTHRLSACSWRAT